MYRGTVSLWRRRWLYIRPLPSHVNASPAFLLLSKFSRNSFNFEMSFSAVALLVSLALCLPYGDAKPTNMIFMLMDDVSWLL
jgi:hypothetical protein